MTTHVVMIAQCIMIAVNWLNKDFKLKKFFNRMLKKFKNLFLIETYKSFSFIKWLLRPIILNHIIRSSLLSYM